MSRNSFQQNRPFFGASAPTTTFAKMTIVAGICGCVQFLTSCGPVGSAMAGGSSFQTQNSPVFHSQNVLGNPDTKSSAATSAQADSQSEPEVSVETALDQSCNGATVDASLIKVCTLVNQQRAQQKDAALKIDPKLSAIAQAFAQDMANKNYFSHTAPDGTTMTKRFDNGGVSFMWAGENIAEGQPDASAVVTAWMNSPGHRANILQSNYHKIGIGRVGLIWVQEFSD